MDRISNKPSFSENSNLHFQFLSVKCRWFLRRNNLPIASLVSLHADENSRGVGGLFVLLSSPWDAKYRRKTKFSIIMMVDESLTGSFAGKLARQMCSSGGNVLQVLVLVKTISLSRPGRLSFIAVRLGGDYFHAISISWHLLQPIFFEELPLELARFSR